MFKFTPKLNQETRDIIENKEKLKELANCYGSPLNILFPNLMDKNISNFKETLKKHHLSGKIYYAHKCNKSNSFLKQALQNQINVDIASLEELKSALSNGFTGDKIEATGPKNDDFIILGIRHNIIFNVDNLEEIKKINYFKEKIQTKNKIRILLRLNGFKSEETKILNRNSRFGTPKSQVNKLIEYAQENDKNLEIIGISFHLDTVNVKEKILAIENCIEIFEEMFEQGLNPYVLDIGGGFKVNYIESQEEWDNSISELKEAILSGNNDLTWNNTSFGLRVEKGVLRGILNIHDYYNEITGNQLLDEILSSRLTKFQNREIGEILSENMIELYIEPGCSLLDGAGINIAKVNFVKENEKGDYLVGLDMKRSDLLIGEQEMFVDPILISDSKEESNGKGVFFIGNLCMENDIIFKRKIFTDKIPQSGDLVVFANTAGYFMDFEQSHTIKQKIATKIIVTFENEKINLYMDEHYEPLKCSKEE
jgi:orn/DAP/arg decarboxylase 2